jgi:pimeloyl-ACP methyl ester carboxylesterase
MGAWQGAKVTVPALFVAGDRDLVLEMRPAEGQKDVVPNLRRSVILPGCGHWTQQERPAEVNAELIRFLSEMA